MIRKELRQPPSVKSQLTISTMFLAKAKFTLFSSKIRTIAIDVQQKFVRDK